jgi:hypothetical protein
VVVEEDVFVGGTELLHGVAVDDDDDDDDDDDLLPDEEEEDLVWVEALFDLDGDLDVVDGDGDGELLSR